MGTRQRLGDPSTSRQVPGIPQTPEAGREAGPRFSTSSGGTRPSDTVNSGPQPPAIRSWPLVPPALGLSSIKRAVPGLHGRGSNPQDRPWTPRLCEPPARKHHVCGHVLPPRVSSGRSPPAPPGGQLDAGSLLLPRTLGLCAFPARTFSQEDAVAVIEHPSSVTAFGDRGPRGSPVDPGHSPHRAPSQPGATRSRCPLHRGFASSKILIRPLFGKSRSQLALPTSTSFGGGGVL